MKDSLLAAQIVVSAVLVGLILIQARGTGFARGWTASSASFTRRGLEKLIFRATFLFSALFILISLASLAI
ncbi:preprotein translocase subunit SecG [Candidatus Woesebacteria bacterium RIFCSPLOWO2_01_FULL_43_11]|uniref:Protein-export membrane protein SecG n=1 Tax=Candidatus Woesebacteria bacterium RBG_16_42_24 TaxID=1802485 RepID=A0A1F7XKA4_9BACT|nr:MAG: preprotein translocase subunit SecG [Candidatus Woesebacteria bacterium RBG_16_42_24]OGM67101.1 MAG: preprotein translocase subunit SecG [Candidatus Woesebacteria bacterium RIFCSPLOWO2_01_FULL_43_11]